MSTSNKPTGKPRRYKVLQEDEKKELAKKSDQSDERAQRRERRNALPGTRSAAGPRNDPEKKESQKTPRPYPPPPDKPGSSPPFQRKSPRTPVAFMSGEGTHREPIPRSSPQVTPARLFSESPIQAQEREMRHGRFDNEGDVSFDTPAPEKEVLGRDMRGMGETEFDVSAASSSSSSSSSSSDASFFSTSSSTTRTEPKSPFLVPTSTSDGMSGPGGESVIQNQENLESSRSAIQTMLTDAVALGAARALAGAPGVPKPTQTNVGGYMGTRNVENGDILNSGATGTAKSATGGMIPASERKGDAFAVAKESHNTSTDTLRPTFGIAPPNGVIPPKTDQVRSDILFSDFSVVAPGNGLGVTNKMFLMEEWREKNFVFKEPLAEPRSYQGPTGCVEPTPLQLQNEITRRDRRTLQAQTYAAEATGVVLERRAGAGSLNILGDDYGLSRAVSAKGLKRERESPLEPVIVTPNAWERVKPLPGFQYARKEPRRLFDADRYPERFASHMAMSGGPTMSKRNSLATFPFPITSH